MSKPLSEDQTKLVAGCEPLSKGKRERLAMQGDYSALARLDFLEKRVAFLETKKAAAADQLAMMVREFIDADGSVAETWMRQALSIYDKVTE